MPIKTKIWTLVAIIITAALCWAIGFNTAISMAYHNEIPLNAKTIETINSVIAFIMFGIVIWICLMPSETHKEPKTAKTLKRRHRKLNTHAKRTITPKTVQLVNTRIPRV